MKILSLYQIYMKIKDIRMRCVKKCVLSSRCTADQMEREWNLGGGGAFFSPNLFLVLFASCARFQNVFISTFS